MTLAVEGSHGAKRDKNESDGHRDEPAPFFAACRNRAWPLYHPDEPTNAMTQPAANLVVHDSRHDTPV